MASSLRIRGVESIKHEIDEYVTISIYMPETDAEGNNVLASFNRELHLIDDLRAKMLIGNDILGPEEIFIDIA